MRALRSTLPYLRPYRLPIAAGLACVVAANLFEVATPYLVKLAIDGLADPATTTARIGLIASLIVASALIGGVFRFGMRELLNGVSRRMEADLRNDFFRHLLRLDATYHGSVRTGDLMSRATNDTLAVRMATGPAVMYAVNTVTIFGFAVAMMLWISPRLTVVALLPMLVLPPIVLGFGRVIHRRFSEIQEQFSALSTFVQENLTGVRIVRAYAQEQEQARQFDAFNRDYRARNMRLVLTAGAFHPVLMLLSGIAIIVVTWTGGREVIAGRITVGDFVAFGFYLAQLVWPMIALGWVVNLFQRGSASMARLDEILHAEPSVRAPAAPRAAAAHRGAIEFRHVSFTYPGSGREVLHDLSFAVRPGETVAIVGPTGSGKSTLLALLVRLYDPTSGQVLLDGVPLTELDPEELRHTIGIVPQDSFLFSETISENIGLGLDEPDPSRVQAIVEASRLAQIDEQIRAFPAGYDTMVGERGVNLSGGQKQRTALARALARRPRVLILDDALSAVDTQTETRILEELRRLLADRTAFLVSHRVSAVMNADLILVLEAGRIVQRGTHAELIRAEGTYARLLRRQLLEEEVERGRFPSAAVR